MRGCLQPGQPYRPVTTEKRKRMRDAQLKRLGIPQGQRRLYGVIVPEGIANKLRPWATELASKHGYQDAQAFVKREIGGINMKQSGGVFDVETGKVVHYRAEYGEDPNDSFISFDGNVKVALVELCRHINFPYILQRPPEGYRKLEDFTAEEISLYYPYALVLASLDGNAFTHPDVDTVKYYIPHAYEALKSNGCLEWVAKHAAR